MRNPVIEEDLRFILSRTTGWERLDGKTVLVSGANGFLPAYMVETILYRNECVPGPGTKVIGIVRNGEKARARFAHYEGRPDFQLIVQDVCRPVTLSEKVDFIVHAASQASPKYFGSDPVGTIGPNVLGTHHLLELARDNDVGSFLFFSSGEVYGEVDETRIPTRENDYGPLDPMNVRSCYAESKRMGENMCVAWCSQHGVTAKIVRPFHTYGPGMSLDDGRVFADFVSDVVYGRDIVMRSDGSAMRAFCYLADATIAFFLVLLHGRNGEAYNVGNDKAEIRIADLAELLVQMSPEKILSVVRNEACPTKGYIKSRISRACPDVSKLRAMGWEPVVTVPEGFKRTVRSYLT